MSTDAQFCAALKAANGVPNRAAEILGVTRQAVCQRIDRNPEFQAFVKDIEAGLIEKSVSIVAKAIDAEDLPTAKWLLERKGKHLGFALKSEVENRIADDQMEALVLAMGGDVEKLAALKGALEG